MDNFFSILSIAVVHAESGKRSVHFTCGYAGGAALMFLIFPFFVVLRTAVVISAGTSDDSVSGSEALAGGPTGLLAPVSFANHSLSA